MKNLEYTSKPRRFTSKKGKHSIYKKNCRAKNIINSIVKSKKSDHDNISQNKPWSKLTATSIKSTRFTLHILNKQLDNLLYKNFPRISVFNIEKLVEEKMDCSIIEEYMVRVRPSMYQTCYNCTII